MLCGLTVAQSCGWTQARGYPTLEAAIIADKSPRAFDDKDFYLYFLNAGPYTKIGLATNPDKRLAEIQVGCPLKIEKFRLFYAGETDLAFLLERRIHKFFESKHTNGEWFALDEGDFEKIRTAKELCCWNKKDPFSPLTSDEAWELTHLFMEKGMAAVFAT